MRETVVSGFKSLRAVNLTSKTKNVAEGRKCTKTRNREDYRIKIRAKRKKNNTIDNTSMILAWKTKNVLGSQTSLKMKNWKHYSMKIVDKHKKSSQNLWESLKQPFQNV